jgi:hypothetical protein
MIRQNLRTMRTGITDGAGQWKQNCEAASQLPQSGGTPDRNGKARQITRHELLALHRADGLDQILHHPVGQRGLQGICGGAVLPHGVANRLERIGLQIGLDQQAGEKSREFPYSVVYLEQPDRVWIVAVMHAKRQPGYWHNRL